MKNLHLLVDPQVVLEVRFLLGRLEPTTEGEVPYLDDPQSFRIAIDRAETAISAASLSALLNSHVFAYPDAPLAELKVEVKDQTLRQSGILHKGIDIPFSMDADLTLTGQGLLRLHPTAIKAARVPVKKLLDLLDLELVELINLREDRGVRIEENDLLLDPRRMLPAPQVRGQVGAAKLAGDRLVLTFVPPDAQRDESELPAPSLPEAENYMFFYSGRLRFGKLTMIDTDLQIVDADPRDPFLFFLSRYTAQLVAGHSRTMPDLGLVAVMPDYDELDGKESAAGRAP